MFVKPLVKYNKTTKQRYNIFQLCESFRLDGRVRHRVIIGLGKLEELLGEEQKKFLGKRIEELLIGQDKELPLSNIDEDVEKLAHHYCAEIKKKRRYDTGESDKDWQTVDLSTLKNKDGREIGAEWLCKQAFDQLGIAKFLQNKGWKADKIILYDLTNTYFEGQMKNSKLAKFGRNKEKHKDARLIVLAVVINREGFLKYSNIFEGNMVDSKTLETIINALSKQTSFSDRKPVVVIDAGIATEDNLKMLKGKQYDYMCVSRSNLKEYYADTDSAPIEIKDKRNQPIELMKVKVGQESSDKYLWVKSKAKALKENSMNGLLSQRFEEGEQSISEGINKKGGTKKLDKVYERIGRLKQKYPSVNRYYDIIVEDV